MASLLDQMGLGGLDERFQRFSTDPLGMASLGLLLQPRRRKEGTGGFEYAAKGLQAAARNREAQAYAQRLEEETKARQQEQERQARVMQMLSAGATPEERALMASMSPEEAMNYQEYKLKIQADQQRRIEAQQAQAQQERQMQAAMEYINSLPEPQRSLAMADPMKYVGTAMESQFGGGQASPADIQKYQLAKNEGFTGSFMDFMSQMRPAPTPIYSAVPTARGLQAFNQRTGRVENIAPGVIPAAQDPTLAGRKAELTAVGTAKGQVSMAPQVAQAEASKQAQILAAQESEKRKQASLGAIRPLERKAEESINLLNEFMNHPGFESLVGAGLGFGTKYIPGSEAAGANAIWENIQSKNYLSSIEAFRGFGPLSNTEGEAAAKAYTDMSTATSEEDFMKAAQRFYNNYVRLIETAKKEAGVLDGTP